MTGRLELGDVRDVLPRLLEEGVTYDCVVTSPPYWGQRDYDVEKQIGLERTFEEYLEIIVAVFGLVREGLAKDGTMWLNLGDAYYTPRWGGSVGENSTINGTRTQAAFRDAQRLRRGSLQETLKGSPVFGAQNRARNRAPAGVKPKDLIGMPWRIALALQQQGWWLRQDIIWNKRNPMPESVRDRCTKAHEYLFLLTKSEIYSYDADAIKEPASPDTHARYARGRSDNHKWADGGPGNQTIAKSFGHMLKKPVAGWARGTGLHEGIAHARSKTHGRCTQGLRDSTKFGRAPGWRKLAAHGTGIKANDSFYRATMRDIPDYRNKRSVWTIATDPYKEAHFATFPRALVEPCILAGCRPGGTVFDPFMGSGTVAAVAETLGVELNQSYAEMIARRAAAAHPGLAL